jgi:hypothetical protein
MMQAVGVECIDQGLQDMFLADHLRKAGWSPFAR